MPANRFALAVRTHHSREKRCKMSVKLTLVAITVCAFAASSTAADTVQVGGEAMYPNKTIVDNAMKSADHTTLVAAVKAGGLIETLQGKGPFTVFAPVNAAFKALPEGTVETLLKPENKDKLVAILTYHVVPGRVTYAALERQIKISGGMA